MKKLLVSLLALSIGFAAFGGGKKEETPAAKPAPAKAAEVVELRFWHYHSTVTMDAMNGLVAQYNEKMKGKVFVKVEQLPRNELLKKYTMGLIAKELPDIGIVDNPDNQTFSAMGVFADVSAEFKAWKDSQYFMAGPMESGYYKGKLYGIPYSPNCLGLWYNIDMFEKAGIKEPPKTWADLEAVSAALLKSAKPGTYPLAIGAIKDESGSFQVLPWVRSAGANVDNLDSPEAVKALTFLTGMVKKGYMTKEIINLNQNTIEKEFAAGNAAMMINGPWNIPAVKKDAPTMRWDIAPIPKDKEYASALGGENIAIMSTTKFKKEAWDFVTWFLAKENNITFVRAASRLSPRSDISPDELYPTDKEMKKFVGLMQYTKARGPSPKWTEISNVFQIAYQECFTETKPVEQALKEAAKKIAEINASIK
ncbi:MAG: sugar ABC transporter substrate-binding protein [Treponemataceae bacterium]